MPHTLKYPLVAILLAPEEAMWLAALAGEKQVTIRQGYRDYRAGTTGILCCHIMSMAVMIDITEVRHTTIGELSFKELMDDGFDDHDHCVREMKRFYPDIALDSAVTVIRWNNIRGGLIDELQKAEK